MMQMHNYGEAYADHQPGVIKAISLNDKEANLLS